METSNLKNMVVLKNLPSNIVDEAIIVLKANKKTKKLQKIENVVMLVPVVYPNLGGVTSALRILTSLQNKGCKLTLAVCSEEMTMEEAKKNIKACMPSYEGEVNELKECLSEEYDVCIATSWQTAYYAQKISGYKVYFVQDYEPEFYERKTGHAACDLHGIANDIFHVSQCALQYH